MITDKWLPDTTTALLASLFWWYKKPKPCDYCGHDKEDHLRGAGCTVTGCKCQGYQK